MLTSWYRAWGILGHEVSFWLLRHTVFSSSSTSSSSNLLRSCGGVCLCACWHELVLACICMCVYVLVPDNAGNIILGGLRENDEWRSALQLFLNSKGPLYQLMMEREVLIQTCNIAHAMQGQRVKHNDLKFPYIYIICLQVTSVDWPSRLLSQHNLIIFINIQIFKLMKNALWRYCDI